MDSQIGFSAYDLYAVPDKRMIGGLIRQILLRQQELIWILWLCIQCTQLDVSN